MNNPCKFSPCRRYRYELIHRIEGVAPHPVHGDTFLPWIGLNPSTADENQLDPTLKRIRSFTAAAGFNHFVMLNLFAWRATDPDDMREAFDPIGRENDETIRAWAQRSQFVVCAWGSYHGHISRWKKVVEIVKAGGAQLFALGTNLEGHPKHPLYLKAETILTPWEPPKEVVADLGERMRRSRALNRKKCRLKR